MMYVIVAGLDGP